MNPANKQLEDLEKSLAQKILRRQKKRHAKMKVYGASVRQLQKLMINKANEKRRKPY